ncbi:DMT family transporter [Ferroglobus sp.]|uniref:DMT family transporter n=1 Tax=Ferroglobus sp. TaxID=2614230 RepID=UPI0025C1D60E|nr:DMT family transporter [Ferroglobus sp.]
MIVGVILAVIAAFCWGAGGSVFKRGLRGISEIEGNLLRSIFVTIYIFPAVAISGFRGYGIDVILLLISSAILAFFVGDLLYFASLKKSAVSVSLPLASTYPIHVLILSSFFYGTEVTAELVLSSLLVLLAVVIVPKESGNGISGAYLALLAALSWALSMIILDYLTKIMSVVEIAFYRMLINSAMLFALVRSVRFDKESLLFMGVVGGLISAIGILSFVKAVELIGSHRVSPISATSPVIGAVISRIYLKEKLTVRSLTAAFLVFLSVLFVSKSF